MLRAHEFRDLPEVDLELVDTLGDPERPVDEERIVAKMHSLARYSGLGRAQADHATRLALEGDDAQAIDAMLEEWIR